MVEHRLTTYRRNLRKTLLWLLGGKCLICGETDWRVLQIDHTEGARRFMAKIPMLTKKKVEDYVAQAWKGEIQVLCANCNWRKRHTHFEIPRRTCVVEQPVVK